MKKVLVPLIVVVFLAIFAVSSHAAILVDCDFEGGDIFSTKYIPYTSGDMGLAQYAVGSNPHNYHSLWNSYSAYGGSGNMMIVNGDAAGNTVWSVSNVSVTSGTYYFSAYVASSYASNLAKIDFMVNNDKIGTFTAPSPSEGWTKYTATWNSSGNQTITLSLVDSTKLADGNDFTLDNIAFEGNAVPVPPSVWLLGSGLLGLYGIRRRFSKKQK